MDFQGRSRASKEKENGEAIIFGEMVGRNREGRTRVKWSPCDGIGCDCVGCDRVGCDRVGCGGMAWGTLYGHVLWPVWKFARSRPKHPLPLPKDPRKRNTEVLVFFVYLEAITRTPTGKEECRYLY